MSSADRPPPVIVEPEPEPDVPPAERHRPARWAQLTFGAAAAVAIAMVCVLAVKAATWDWMAVGDYGSLRLRALDVGSVDIRKRGSAVDVEQVQRRLKLGGTRPATVVLTRVANSPWAFVCTGLRK